MQFLRHLPEDRGGIADQLRAGFFTHINGIGRYFEQTYTSASICIKREPYWGIS